MTALESSDDIRRAIASVRRRIEMLAEENRRLRELAAAHLAANAASAKDTAVRRDLAKLARCTALAGVASPARPTALPTSSRPTSDAARGSVPSATSSFTGAPVTHQPISPAAPR